MTDTAVHDDTAGTLARLSTLDRFLPIWSAFAMAAGLLPRPNGPGLSGVVSAVRLDGVSLPIALGLLVMMYPVLAKVATTDWTSVTGDRKLLISALVWSGWSARR